MSRHKIFQIRAPAQRSEDMEKPQVAELLEQHDRGDRPSYIDRSIGTSLGVCHDNFHMIMPIPSHLHIAAYDIS